MAVGYSIWHFISANICFQGRVCYRKLDGKLPYPERGDIRKQTPIPLLFVGSLMIGGGGYVEADPTQHEDIAKATTGGMALPLGNEHTLLAAAQLGSGATVVQAHGSLHSERRPLFGCGWAPSREGFEDVSLHRPRRHHDA